MHIEHLQLSQSIELEQHQIDFYKQHKFIKLKNIFDASTIIYYNTVISNEVKKLQQDVVNSSGDETYNRAFIQLTNLWVNNQEIRSFVFSKRLASIATQLMQCSGVRLYHDQALFKEAGGGITPWHADQYYWPLETDKCITAWIPLQETTLEMGPLEFSSQSHTLSDGREFAISDESEKYIHKTLQSKQLEHVVEPFDIGEISFHSGWIFHRAGVNSTQKVRKVMTVIYMDKAMRLKEPDNEHQKVDWDTWCPGVKVGEMIDSALNPILYEVNK